MGLDLASSLIFWKSLKSPVRSLYGLPWRPCSLSSFSSFFGLSHSQFSTLHPQIRARITMRTMATIVVVHAASISVMWLVEQEENKGTEEAKQSTSEQGRAFRIWHFNCGRNKLIFFFYKILLWSLDKGIVIHLLWFLLTFGYRN